MRLEEIRMTGRTAVRVALVGEVRALMLPLSTIVEQVLMRDNDLAVIISAMSASYSGPPAPFGDAIEIRIALASIQRGDPDPDPDPDPDAATTSLTYKRLLNQNHPDPATTSLAFKRLLNKIERQASELGIDDFYLQVATGQDRHGHPTITISYSTYELAEKAGVNPDMAASTAISLHHSITHD